MYHARRRQLECPCSKASASQVRLPAEWEPHQATWLIWPGHVQPVSHWHGYEADLRRFFLSYAEQLRRSGAVKFLVGDSMPHRPKVELDSAGIESNDIWLRDTAPTFLLESVNSEVEFQTEQRLRALCPRWSAYGGKYQPSQADAVLSSRFTALMGSVGQSLPFVLEGGAIETDGSGTLIASAGSIVNEARNPGLSRQALESMIVDALGVQRLLWVDACLEGDDTDGHVDQLVRFVAPRRVVVACQPAVSDVNHRRLERLKRQIHSFRDARGSRLEVIPINLPANYVVDGQQLPASYLNFYIANNFVFVPVFGASSDGPAMNVLGGCFPDHKVLPIDCRLLVRGRGALHCISRQQPLLQSLTSSCDN